MLELKKIDLPAEIKKNLTATIPPGLIKERDGGGGKQLSYISGSTVIDMLNHAFGYMWNWSADKEWIAESAPFYNKYVKDATGKQVGGWENVGPVCHVRGTLTVFLQGDTGEVITVTKTGYGSKSIIGKQSEQESIFKAAGTDALKKAASLLGIGLELYRDDDEQNYFDALNYDDPWTEEAKAAHKEASDYVRNFMETYEMEAEDMDPQVEEFSEGSILTLADLTPETIDAFVEWLKVKLANAVGTTEEEEA